MTLPLGNPTALPRGTVPGLSLGGPGSIAHLFPVVTPGPAVPGGARGGGPSGGGIATTLTADTGVMGTEGGLIVLAITVAAGLAAFGAWFTMAGAGRKLASVLVTWRGHSLTGWRARSLAGWRARRTR